MLAIKEVLSLVQHDKLFGCILGTVCHWKLVVPCLPVKAALDPPAFTVLDTIRTTRAVYTRRPLTRATMFQVKACLATLLASS